MFLVNFFYMSLIFISFDLLMVGGVYLIISSYNTNLSLKYRNWRKLIKLEKDINAGNSPYIIDDCFEINSEKKQLILKKIDPEWELKSIFQIYFYDWNIAYLILFNFFISGWTWIILDQIFLNKGQTIISFLIGLYFSKKGPAEYISGVTIPILIIILPLLVLIAFVVINKRYYYVRKLIIEADKKLHKKLKLKYIISQNSMIVIISFWFLVLISSIFLGFSL